MKTKVAVVAGGNSGEFQISVQSGTVVHKYLDREKFDPYFVLIQQLDWMVAMPDGRQLPVNRHDFSVDTGAGLLHFDVVFIAIHGDPGENGKLQAYFDLIGLPYTTCDQLVSALSFNKDVCKQLVRQYDVPVAFSVLLQKGDSWDESEILSNLGLPVFVKPNSNGSSVGVTKVKEKEALADAINASFSVDHEVVIEAFMPGREITCAVFTEKDKLTALPICEIIPKNEFFDYDAKYTPGKSDEIVPAEIPDEAALRCQETSLRLYKLLHCRGVVRFDYIYDDPVIRFLEVNTVPGFTDASIVPKMARAYGFTLQEFFGKLVEEALR